MKVDFLIIGQGIAGSTLALELLKREKSVLVVDRQDTGSSTRVAAGLVTPLTGKGMNTAWRQEEYLPKAVAYYHALEKELDRLERAKTFFAVSDHQVPGTLEEVGKLEERVLVCRDLRAEEGEAIAQYLARSAKQH